MINPIQTEPSSSTIKRTINDGNGYSLDLNLSKEELKEVKKRINDQWIYRIQIENRNLASRIKKENIQITDYHLISNELNHQLVWRKISRILPPSFAEWFLQSNFFNDLEYHFGEFYISDEEDLGWPNIYWRITRPEEPGDIGPLHCDAWFWELNNAYPKPTYPFHRLKVWIPIYVESGLNGLLIEPKSQKRKDLNWEGSIRDGSPKPTLLTEEKELNPKLIPTEPGNAIIFHDKVLHGGALNKASTSRISIEFTLIIKN